MENLVRYWHAATANMLPGYRVGQRGSSPTSSGLNREGAGRRYRKALTTGLDPGLSKRGSDPSTSSG